MSFVEGFRSYIVRVEGWTILVRGYVPLVNWEKLDLEKVKVVTVKVQGPLRSHDPFLPVNQWH